MRRRISALLVLGLLSPVARAQNYVASVLYPLGGSSLLGLPSPAQIAADGQVVGVADAPSLGEQAVLWNNNSTPIDLNPAGVQYSNVSATDGSQQVGLGWFPSTPGVAQVAHAFVWSGTAASAVDLTPSYASGSVAEGVGDGQQVGYSIPPVGQLQATLWNGTAASAVDIEPTKLAGITDANALNTDGTQQVGEGLFNGASNHALLWSGTADSAVDLNPSSAANSIAYGVANGQEVGVADGQPVLWTGTAASATYLSSAPGSALATNGSIQVGYTGILDDDNAATVWFSSADSAVDLQSLLPSNFTHSAAYSIDSNGDIFGLAFTTSSTDYYAVEWTPVPEPAVLPLVLISAPLFVRRGRFRDSWRNIGIGLTRGYRL